MKPWPLEYGLRCAAVLLSVALLSACGGGSGGGATPVTPAPTPTNTLSVIVDAGPSNNEINRLYASVTVCQPGSSTCQTIDHVLVDTGSTGLRLLSGLLGTTLQLPRQTTATGMAVLNCAQFVDTTYAWGPVATADVTLGGKTVSNMSVQLMGDPAYSARGAACASGTAMDSAAALGANGILGLGLFTEDCGSYCASHGSNGYYFSCSNAACAGVQGLARSTTQQLRNPVALFASDNNGLLVELPAATAAGVSLTGTLIFGIGTQSNNQINGAQLLSTDLNGYISTVFAGQTLNTSFVDTGSNGLYFPSTTLAACPKPYSSDFYCPAARTALSASTRGSNAVTVPVSFAVESATSLFAVTQNTVLPTLAGPSGDQTTFDWGLPFFYGRRVFIGLEGQSSTLGTGPYYAY